MRPTVALLTDFGGQDHYVGAVKGAVLAACGEATIVDIAHDIPAHDVDSAAFALAAAHRAFPAGTVFVAVVDPGVGSDRRGLAIEAAGYRFVGPDNGIFTLVLAEHPEARVHAITNAGLFRHEVSSTFHARDIFGPVAGYLAKGLPLDDVGPAAADPVRFPLEPVRELRPGEWQASVIHVDRFGNLTTNVTRRELDGILGVVGGDPTEIVVVVEGIVIPFVCAYADVPEGEACALAGSSGRLEVAVHKGNASRILGAGRGAPVRVRAVAPSGPGAVL
ncbi:MAG: SAM-dependent chlorinase/fluorinase [Acidobacteria bacterium]|nr:SAM-dependent chlorinase/fluorinase [Acidobacteriota bacterium]